MKKIKPCGTIRASKQAGGKFDSLWNYSGEGKFYQQLHYPDHLMMLCKQFGLDYDKVEKLYRQTTYYTIAGAAIGYWDAAKCAGRNGVKTWDSLGHLPLDWG